MEEFKIKFRTCFNCTDTGSHYSTETRTVKAESYEKACNLIVEEFKNNDEYIVWFKDITFKDKTAIEIMQSLL